MNDHPAILAVKEYQRACRALDSGNVMAALLLLEAAVRHWDNPQWYGMLGYCIAQERGQVARGLELCRSALEQFPDDPQQYYYQARLLLMTGQKSEAVRLLQEGAIRSKSPAIARELQKLGIRKPPLLPHLSRSNPLNKYLGILLTRIGLR